MKTKITAQTTLGELALETAKLGVTSLILNHTSPHRHGSLTCVAYVGIEEVFIGYGATVPEAISEAMSKVAEHVRANLSNEPNR